MELRRSHIRVNHFPSRLPSAFGDMREGKPRPCRKSNQARDR
nr:MAG TPA: hypothetical protein [Bacteriophage sp.]